MTYLKWVLLLLTVLSPVIGDALPTLWVWENGILEWAQVGILLLTAGLCFVWSRQAARAGDRLAAHFWGWFILFWLFLAGREMNWGRVFFVVGIGPDGPMLISSALYPYETFVRVLRTVLASLWLLTLLGLRLFRVPVALMKQQRFPLGEFLVAVAAAVITQVSGHVLYNLRYEEAGETCLYLAMGLVVLLMKPRRQSDAPATVDEVERPAALV